MTKRPERVTLHVCVICGAGYFNNDMPDDHCSGCGTEAEARSYLTPESEAP